MKGHWGRARPSQIQEFGGNLQYSPPLKSRDQCDWNCSFVCGHATIGYSFMIIGALMRKRIVWVIVATIIGGLIGLIRFIQGAHFFSDVVFSFFAIWISLEISIYFFLLMGWSHKYK